MTIIPIHHAEKCLILNITQIFIDLDISNKLSIYFYAHPIKTLP